MSEVNEVITSLTIILMSAIVMTLAVFIGACWAWRKAIKQQKAAALQEAVKEAEKDIPNNNGFDE